MYANKTPTAAIAHGGRRTTCYTILRIESILLFLEGSDVFNMIYISFVELLGVAGLTISAIVCSSFCADLVLLLLYKALFNRCILQTLFAPLLHFEASE